MKDYGAITQLFDIARSAPWSLFCSAAILAAISLLAWKGKGRQWIMVLTVLLYARYIVWRGTSTLNMEDAAGALLGWSVYLAECYAFVQVLLFAYHAWNPLERQSRPLTRHPTVDVFVTVVNEPLSILRRTLVGCLQQDYPADRYRVHVLDDGRREDIRTLAATLGCGYIRRSDRAHAKAGNLNHALGRTSAELIAIFDVDHVPTSDFLRATVGFFDDPKVAFVQTPHHFFNPDIFQKNLRLERFLKNEQSLFYRVLQAGRDRHNSAFFAGSCGLFRRAPLQDIGGFRTETVTEDIHTSMALHARGYRSCYLNKVLAVGLSPETFDSYIKQRVRWAMGHVQILFQSNPLLMRGLTLHQRLGYFASIWYFLHGLPRLLALVAPLGALLFGIIPVMADAWSLAHFFGAYYLATLLMLRAVGNGTRNAFWSDVYETAGCVALSGAMVKTILRPWKRRAFVITPKGHQQETRRFAKVRCVWPHLLLFGALIGGLTTGLYAWLEGTVVAGLGVSLFWGAANLVLIGVAILSAAEWPEWRKTYRVPCQAPCIVITPDAQLEGGLVDLSEHGAQVRILQPLPGEPSDILLSFLSPQGDRVTVTARVRRQQPLPEASIGMGLEFADVDGKTVQAILATMSADSAIWNHPEVEHGIWHSLTSLFSVFRLIWAGSRRSQRKHQRMPASQPCRVVFGTHSLEGALHDVSRGGCSVKITAPLGLVGEDGTLYLDQWIFRIRRMWAMDCGVEILAGFRIEHIEQGGVPPSARACVVSA